VQRNGGLRFERRRARRCGRYHDHAGRLLRLENDGEIAAVGSGALDVIGRPVGHFHHDPRDERLAAVLRDAHALDQRPVDDGLRARGRRDVGEIQHEPPRPVQRFADVGGREPAVAAQGDGRRAGGRTGQDAIENGRFDRLEDGRLGRA
jgi:hypothetical protein